MKNETITEFIISNNKFFGLKLCLKNINFCGIREKCKYKYSDRCIGSLAKNEFGYKDDCTCVINEKLRDMSEA